MHYFFIAKHDAGRKIYSEN